MKSGYLNGDIPLCFLTMLKIKIAPCNGGAAALLGGFSKRKWGFPVIFRKSTDKMRAVVISTFKGNIKHGFFGVKKAGREANVDATNSKGIVFSPLYKRGKRLCCAQNKKLQALKDTKYPYPAFCSPKG